MPPWGAALLVALADAEAAAAVTVFVTTEAMASCNFLEFSNNLYEKSCRNPGDERRKRDETRSSREAGESPLLLL
jgi:hypothetical protein